MVKGLVIFVLLWLALYFGLDFWRSVTRQKKLEMVLGLIYSLGIAIIVMSLLTLMVILF